MSFDPAWLDMREPADHAARSQGLLRAFAEMMPKAARILDLGSGTGSTMRAVSPLLPGASWTLTDHDPALLALARERAPDVETVQIDLATDLAGLLARDADAITASALIDLVSADWHIALSYDGREAWTPSHESDSLVFEAFQSHQRGDKGFGPALGADAVPYLSAALTKIGYQVQTAVSLWQLQPGGLMTALAEGIAGAAVEAGVALEIAEKWAENRANSAHCCVGHLDFLAYK